METWGRRERKKSKLSEEMKEGERGTGEQGKMRGVNAGERKSFISVQVPRSNHESGSHH